MMSHEPSLSWPASGTDPNAHTALSADDLVAIGGGAALRSYIADRMALVAPHDRDAPKSWSRFAVDHLVGRLGDQTDGGVEVSAASLQMILAYVEHLERVG